MRIHALVAPAVLTACLLLGLRPERSAMPESPVLPAPRAGIRTDKNFTAEQLIQDIFVKGGCKNISNIQAIGNVGGIGYFENGATSIGLNKGIILSTGHIGNAEGPNRETDRSGDFGDPAGDVDLRRLASARLFDAVGIEFDFVPLDSIVTFRYVFASEEYCEYVGSKFNDVFGFFISGPGIQGEFSRNGANVALIPGSGDYVSINSVNHLRNANYYVPNELANDARVCGKPFVENAPRGEIEFDGFTKVLVALLNLIPCETYHLRLVVGDVNDNLYDSAVFLEAESFNIGGEVKVNSEVTIDTSFALEGCSSGQFVFQRVNTTDLSKDLTVNFLLRPDGSAQEGIDFEPLPRSIVIPAGDLTATLPVTAFSDGIAEAPETIVLELSYPCDCVTGDATLVVADAPLMQLELGDIALCPGEETSLRPTIRLGTPPYSYRWNTGDTTATLVVVPDATTTYQLTVTDACGQQISGRATVALLEPARAELSGYQDLCPGGEGALTVTFTGEPPWQFTYSIDGQEAETFSGLRTNPYSLRVRRPGFYLLTSFRDARCDGVVAGNARVDITQVAIRAEPRPVSCHGLSDGRVDVVVGGGDPPYAYQWDQGQGNRRNLQNVPAGVYTLQVADAKGCRDTAQVVVSSPPPIQEVTFDCLDLGTDSIAFTTGGGSPPYRFSVDGTSFSDASLFRSLREGQFYNLVILDAKGCRLEQEFVMPANTREYINLPAEVNTILGEKYTFDPQILIPPSLVRNIQWSPRTDLSCSNCLQPILIPQVNRTYTLRVTDRFGCWDESTIIINVNRQASVFVPTVFSPNNDGNNDVFMIFADLNQIGNIRFFQVFNRWGNLLYEVRNILPNDPTAGWDGRFRGKWQDPGIYIYVAEIELVNGNVLMKKGDVMLMR